MKLRVITELAVSAAGRMQHFVPGVDVQVLGLAENYLGPVLILEHEPEAYGSAKALLEIDTVHTGITRYPVSGSRYVGSFKHGSGAMLHVFVKVSQA